VLLDTNVALSRPDPKLAAALGPCVFVVSALSYAEIAEGEYARDPAVRAKAPLETELARAAFGPGLPFDDAAARIYRAVCRAVDAAGRAVNRARRVDLMIAAVALANGCVLATRNRADFAPLEGMLEVVDL
jgi:predicted nucleic acid-binding protein